MKKRMAEQLKNKLNHASKAYKPGQVCMDESVSSMPVAQEQVTI